MQANSSGHTSASEPIDEGEIKDPLINEALEAAQSIISRQPRSSPTLGRDQSLAFDRETRTGLTEEPWRSMPVTAELVGGRAANALRRIGHHTLGDIANLTNAELLDVPGVGRGTLHALQSAVRLLLTDGGTAILPPAVKSERPGSRRTGSEKTVKGSGTPETPRAEAYGHDATFTLLGIESTRDYSPVVLRREWPDDWDGCDWSEALDGQPVGEQFLTDRDARRVINEPADEWSVPLAHETLRDYWAATHTWHSRSETEDAEELQLDRWGIDQAVRALRLVRTEFGYPWAVEIDEIGSIAASARQSYRAGRAFVRYVGECDQGLAVPTAYVRHAMSTFARSDFQKLGDRADMIRDFDDFSSKEDDGLDLADRPDELALPDTHVPAAADGQPDPLAQIRNLLPGGRWVLGKAQIVHSPTELDTVLLPTILSQPPTLVILSGNAGDGKTAFIESVLEEAGELRKPVPNEIDVRIGGHAYRVVLDGSEDTSDRSNDQLLEGALGAFAGSSPVAPDRGTLIAVNKGRLLSFLEEHKDRYSYLWELAHQRFVDGVHGSDVTYLLIDLNDRTVVGPDLDESLFGQVLTKLVQWDGWTECARCDAVEQCPVMLNVGALRHRQVQERLWKLFALIDLDDRLHVTARHIVTRLASVISGGQRCPDIRRVVSRGGDFPHRAYFYGAAFVGRADESSVEEALFNDIASAYDPAETSSPTRDRRLGLAISSGTLADALATQDELPRSDVGALEREAAGLAARTVDSPGVGDIPEYRMAHLGLMAKVLRRQFLMSDRSSEVVPVQAFETYRAIAAGGEGELVRRIIESLNATLGIRRTGTLGLIIPRDYSRGLSGSGFALTIPENAFRVAPGTGLGTPFQESEYTRSWPRSVLFSAEDGDRSVATLSIPLLMLEILGRADRGFRPTSRTERSYLVRVGTFYRRLAEHRWRASYDYVMYERGRVRASVAVSADSLNFWVP